MKYSTVYVHYEGYVSCSLYGPVKTNVLVVKLLDQYPQHNVSVIVITIESNKQENGLNSLVSSSDWLATSVFSSFLLAQSSRLKYILAR